MRVTDDPRPDDSAVESLLKGVDQEFAEYNFRPADEVFGDEGIELVAWWAQALAERALIHPDHYSDLANRVLVEFATTPEPTMRVSFDGHRTWSYGWGATVDDARVYLVDLLPDYAGEIKAERGYSGGHHPWDDPVDT